MKFDIAKERAAIIARHYAQFPKEQPAGATGPKTDAGKQRASINAYKHGLTGQIHLCTPDEHDAFEKHCRSIVEALAPVGILEQDLAQSIAADKWRLNRARAIEDGIFAIRECALPIDPSEKAMWQAISQAQTWLAEGRDIQLLSLYQQRIQRSIERNMAELRTLRAERKAARDHAVEEAVLLSQLAKSKGEAYNPAADFPLPPFVFSTAEFDQLIARKQRLNEARQTANPGQKRPAAA